VPQAAIQRNNDAAYVYVEQPDHTVKSVDVAILATEAGTSAITGVKPGDQLVTDGFDKLQNGSKIVTRKATPEAGAAAKKPG
jgi:multidrug efflux system membrane fusion protein